MAILVSQTRASPSFYAVLLNSVPVRAPAAPPRPLRPPRRARGRRRSPPAGRVRPPRAR
jgi:hypothetical protein